VRETKREKSAVSKGILVFEMMSSSHLDYYDELSYSYGIEEG